MKKYTLPELPYNYKDLEPHISEEQLKIHHTKHHNAYVEKANTILDKIGDVEDMKATLKELSFHIGGHVLHSLFWQTMTPDGGGKPKGALLEAINDSFKSFDNFKKQFTVTAKSVEGSGWAALTYCKKTRRMLLMQIEKHNMNIYPGFGILMVLDMWEHAFYIDNRNDKSSYIDAFWNLVDWQTVEERYQTFSEE